jgi:hypothetical protein
VFLSYKNEEDALAGALQQKLQAFDHDVRLDKNTVAAGQNWRERLFDELSTSDAQVALLTEAALGSQFILAEIGTARAFQKLKGTLIIPVLVESRGIPEFIKDLNAIILPDRTEGELDRAAIRIDEAIRAHVKQLRGRYRPIFISHRHKDVQLVRALTTLLRKALDLEPEDIRCTSVHPYKLRVGQRTPDRLREEISRAKAVIGVLTPDTKDSSYVLFELGAAWGQDVLTFPLLAKGATQANIPSPISDRHPLTLTDPDECRQLLDDLADVLGSTPTDTQWAACSDTIAALTESAAAAVQPASPIDAPKAPSGQDSREASPPTAE